MKENLIQEDMQVACRHMKIFNIVSIREMKLKLQCDISAHLKEWLKLKIVAMPALAKIWTIWTIHTLQEGVSNSAVP